MCGPRSSGLQKRSLVSSETSPAKIVTSMLLLNLGCGSRVHQDWVNIDHFPRAWLRHLPLLRRFAPASLPPNFVNHDLRQGVPFSDGKAEAVYSSHLLEHLPVDSVHFFIKEQWRVLKKGGIIRIVVPDLETAARQYLASIDRCRALGDEGQLEHEWTTILLLDQMVRTQGGGQVQAWLTRHYETEFVRSMKGIFQQIARNSARRPQGTLRAKLRSWMGLKNAPVSASEMHRWMYDELSLKRLLSAHGFNSITRVAPENSSILGWGCYYLDCSADGTIHQPESIYIEGMK